MAEAIITKTFEYRLRKNRKFEAAAQKALDDSRVVYNCALEQRILRYRQGKPVDYYVQTKELAEARREIPELKACLCQIQRNALQRLDEAFKAFFKRVKSGAKPGFPRFKAASRYHTFNQDIEKQRPCPLKGDSGSVRVRLSRPIEGTVKQLGITRRADGWYALLTCEIPRSEPIPKTGLAVGIDLGILNFATLSTGETIENPRHLARVQNRLAKTQRIFSKKKRTGMNHNKARRLIILRHLYVARCRKDFHHKESRKLVDRFDSIAIEDLNILTMIQGSRFANSISDVGWGRFTRCLRAKAENAGREFIIVPAAYTSQTCSACGNRQKMPLKLRWFDCTHCGHSLGRDHNAAINIGLGRPKFTPVESHEGR